MDHRRMRIKIAVLLFGIPLTMYGNVFAVSPYATTIQQNIQKKSFLHTTSFPTTIADIPFAARIQNKREGYLPYFNRSAFAGLTIQEQDELESMAYRAEQRRITMLANEPLTTFCTEYPEDSHCTTQTTDTPSVNPHPHIQTTLPDSIYPTSPQPIMLPGVDTPYMRAALTPENINKYGLKTHNGGCTPPERSNHWRNKIQTTGQYQYSNPAFEKFMITAFRKEGECVNHPNDRGGYTCYGCASNGLCAGIDFNTITRGKVENLAYEKIYKKYNIDKLPDAFRGYVLWGMWGSGSVTGIKQFQGALGVKKTGKIDDATIYAAEHYTGDFADTYTKNREQFLRNIVDRDPTQKVFLRGWLNGLALLRPSGCHIVSTNPIYR